MAQREGNEIGEEERGGRERGIGGTGGKGERGSKRRREIGEGN